ncbi:MAG: methyltransferase family protein [Steroidobacteraceae bacterium]
MRTSPVPPPLWMMVFAAAEWLASRFFPIAELIGAPYLRVGEGLMVLALLPALSAFVQFRRARTTIHPHHPERASALVTRGVYTWTRNPMYLSLWLLLIGGAVRLGALSAMLVALCFGPMLTRVQIRAEERALAERFGEAYASYRGRVRRWFGWHGAF